MNTFRKWMLPFAGGALVALALMLATPRAAHAVAAALVQVTNTAASPAVTQDIGQQANQMITLWCEYTPSVSGGSSCSELLPVPASPYTPPTGQSLVITAIDITDTQATIGGLCPDTMTTSLSGSAGAPLYQSFEISWTLAGGAATTHFTYPPGYAINGPIGVISRNTACESDTYIHGYLTAN